MTSISLEPTRRFQQSLESELGRKSFDMDFLTSFAATKVRERGMVFEADRELPVALSPLVIRPGDFEAIRRLGETLHCIVERAIDWVLSSPERLERLFSDHHRVQRYFAKTPGSPSWQIISRYDAIVGNNGEIKIIELNTACPAGFFHSSGMAEITDLVLHQVDADLANAYRLGGAIPVDALVSVLLAVEEQARQQPGLVALINDENQLVNELSLLSAQFQSRDRGVSIVPASEIEFRNDQAIWSGTPISLSFNKVRVSTADSPNHRWSRGFEQRYRGFLDATLAGAFANVNNMAALTVAEDKGLLAVLHNEEFQSLCDDEDREFIRDHVLPTARLLEEEVWWKGQHVRLDHQAIQSPEQFVIKPANEGRGFGLAVGAHCSVEEWELACRLDPCLPKVVQQHFRPASIRVSQLRGREFELQPMYLTIGLAMMSGRFQGLLSRISTHPVTNISRSGMVQAVFIAEESNQ